VLHAREQLRKRIVVRAAGRAEQDFVGILQPEGDGVAVLKFAAFNFFAVDEETAALSAILDVEAIGFDDHRGAIPGDTPVGKLQMVSGFSAAPDHERSLRDADVAARAVRGDDFENRFISQGRNCVGHGLLGAKL